MWHDNRTGCNSGAHTCVRAKPTVNARLEKLTNFCTSIGDFADLVVGLLLIEYIKKRATRSHKGEVLDQEQNKRFIRVLNRMRLSVFIAAGVGIIPLFGDIFDTVYKANTRNVWLLEQYMKDEAYRTAMNVEIASAQPTQPTRSRNPREGR